MKPILEKMANPAVPTIEGLRISAIKNLNSRAQAWFLESQKEVVVTSHKAIAKGSPLTTLDRASKTYDEFLTIGVVLEDPAAIDTTCCHMVSRANKLDARFAGHRFTMPEIAYARVPRHTFVSSLAQFRCSFGGLTRV